MAMQERKLVPVERLRSEYENCDRWAVIVGISEYQHQSWNLSYAHRDAEELYKLLGTESGGNFKEENICKLINEKATSKNIRMALFDFLQKPAKEDLVIIYFACHGAPDPVRPENLYLLVHDTDPSSIAGTGFPMEDIYKSLNNTLLAQKVIVLADTCHSGGVSNTVGSRSAQSNTQLFNQYLEDVIQSVGGIALLTSAEANEVAREGEQWGGGHGIFTHFLLEGMRGKADRDQDGIITIGELFEYVREKVKQGSDHRQHPSIGSNKFDRNLPIAIANENLSSSIMEEENTSHRHKQNPKKQVAAVEKNETAKNVTRKERSRSFPKYAAIGIFGTLAVGGILVYGLLNFGELSIADRVILDPYREIPPHDEHFADLDAEQVEELNNIFDEFDKVESSSEPIKPQSATSYQEWNALCIGNQNTNGCPRSAQHEFISYGSFYENNELFTSRGWVFYQP